MLALGTAQFGMQYGIQQSGRPGYDDAIKIMDTAVANGVYTLDTAASYGNAEAIIGTYLKRMQVNRGLLNIITKVRADVFEGVAETDYSSVIEREAAASMARLKTDYLDGLLYHNAHDVFNPRAMDALLGVKRGGIVRRVGVSVYTPQEALEALGYDINIIQVPYNVFDRRLDNAHLFEKAKACGVMVIARSVLLQGLLTMDGVPESMRFAADCVKDFHIVCNELCLSPLEAAIGFVARHPMIDCLLFGVDSERQFLEIIEAVHKGMGASEYEQLSCRFRDMPERVVSPQLWPKGV